MALQLPHRTLLRRAATAVALGALVAPAAGAAPAAAKAKRSKLPTVSQVRPMKLAVGDTLEIRGRNFLRGRGKNTVVFHRTGAKAVFVKAGISTRKLMKVEIPERLGAVLAVRDGAQVPTKFRIRILAARFGKRYTMPGGSPTIAPKPAPRTDGDGKPLPPLPPPERPDGDCDGDKVLNSADPDNDNDLLDDASEERYGLDGCAPDSDGDTVTDGYELQSAHDLNDDEYQEPNVNLPYPGKRPYPNPLDGEDAKQDFDGDALTLLEEFRLWKRYDHTGDLVLLYSDGNQFSIYERENGTGRRRPTLRAEGYVKQAEFVAWASQNGYRTVMLSTSAPWFETANQRLFGLFDANRDGVEASVRPGRNWLWAETAYNDFPIGRDPRTGLLYSDGFLSDNERDEDADGLTNYDESHGRMLPSYWKGCYATEKPYPIEYAGTDLTDPDSDGDGIRDGADDQDHDDIPNLMELSRNAASGHVDWDSHKGTCVPSKELTVPDGPDPDELPDPATDTLHRDDYGRVNPFNPCLPYTWSRTCERHPTIGTGSAPFDGSMNWLALQ